MKQQANNNLPHFIAKKIEDDYVLWFTESNHYVQVKEPIWDAAQCINAQATTALAIEAFKEMYDLPLNEASTFINDVIGHFEYLGASGYSSLKIGEKTIRPILKDKKEYKRKNYNFGGRIISISYPDEDNFEHIHSLFFNLETLKKAHIHFDIVLVDKMTYLIKDEKQAWRWKEDAVAYLKGRIFMETLGLMYGKKESDWLAAIHASAISNGKSTVILTAKSKSGKSTFGGLCRMAGYHVLTDDYVPVDLETKRVLPFPMAHSIRKNSFDILSGLLEKAEHNKKVGTYKRKSTGTIYVPSEPFEDLKKLNGAVKALIFIRYNPKVELNFQQISKLECLRKIFDRAWMPPQKENVAVFLDWINELDFFEMEYGNAEMAVQKIDSIFNKC